MGGFPQERHRRREAPAVLRRNPVRHIAGAGQFERIRTRKQRRGVAIVANAEQDEIGAAVVAERIEQRAARTPKLQPPGGLLRSSGAADAPR